MEEDISLKMNFTVIEVCQSRVGFFLEGARGENFPPPPWFGFNHVMGFN